MPVDQRWAHGAPGPLPPPSIPCVRIRPTTLPAHRAHRLQCQTPRQHPANHPTGRGRRPCQGAPPVRTAVLSPVLPHSGSGSSPLPLCFRPRAPARSLLPAHECVPCTCECVCMYWCVCVVQSSMRTCQSGLSITWRWGYPTSTSTTPAASRGWIPCCSPTSRCARRRQQRRQRQWQGWGRAAGAPAAVAMCSVSCLRKHGRRGGMGGPHPAPAARAGPSAWR